MSKVVSLILVLLLFFGPIINSFAASPNGEDDNGEKGQIMLGVIVGVILIGGLLLWMLIDTGIVEAPAPDDGIRMVSSDNETSTTKTSNKTILNVLQHVEAGVTPNKDIYVGLRFQY